MPSIDTLVPDIYKLLDNPNRDWEFDVEREAQLGGRMIRHIRDEISDPDRSSRDPNERYVTQFTSSCPRRIWYEAACDERIREGMREKIAGHNRFKFVYGDLIEEVVLYLAELAGHDVADCQKRLTLDMGNFTVAGRIDAIIDGVLIDVKSMEGFSFDRLLKGTWDDKFGYSRQLGIYYHMLNGEGYQLDGAGILAVNKVNGRMLVHKVSKDDMYQGIKTLHDFSHDPDKFTLPNREVTNKFGNTVLKAGCAYCPFKFDCYKDEGGLTVYGYSEGPTFVVGKHKVPKVPDITKAYMAETGIS